MDSYESTQEAPVTETPNTDVEEEQTLEGGEVTLSKSALKKLAKGKGKVIQHTL